MPITSGTLILTVRYLLLGQKCQTSMAYMPEGAAFLTATAAGVAEAYWNDVKTAWRAMAFNSIASAQFVSVVCREVGGSLGLGEYAIPAGEQAGTRSTGGANGFAPSYVAVGVRLAVGTRITKPGQKRVPFILEDDVLANSASSAVQALADTLAQKWSQPIVLGAPVATGSLIPVVARLDRTNPDVLIAQQEVTGHAVNPFLTSQVSRRYGHGS